MTGIAPSMVLRLPADLNARVHSIAAELDTDVGVVIAALIRKALAPDPVWVVPDQPLEQTEEPERQRRAG